MSLILSTSWNAFRYENALQLVSEIERLGFSKLELSFNLTAKMVSEIAGLVRNNQIRIISLHNFCPIPQEIPRVNALPDCYSLASNNTDQRRLAVKQTKITIDTASELNAKAVVIHAGRVEIPDQTKDLMRAFNRGEKDSSDFKKLRSEIVQDRRNEVKPFFESALKSIDELNHYAQKKNILLGIENRIYFREIPLFDEIGIILREFFGSNVYYWHDTGHAQIMENLGFFKHEEYLKAYSNRMLGLHLHDILGCDDHRAPLQGEFNFKMLLPYVKKETLKVLEAHHPATGNELKESKNYLEELFNEKN